jgi:RNA 2'-phosphotransferase, Tpt1 / KptA family
LRIATLRLRYARYRDGAKYTDEGAYLGDVWGGLRFFGVWGFRFGGMFVPGSYHTLVEIMDSEWAKRLGGRAPGAVPGWRNTTRFRSKISVTTSGSRIVSKFCPKSLSPVNDFRERLSKALSHALRHAPWEYELELDESGWAPIEQVMEALRRMAPFEHVTRADIESMLAVANKQRHEIQGDRIRARYGHSIAVKFEYARAAPPAMLYHGTSPRRRARQGNSSTLETN